MAMNAIIPLNIVACVAYSYWRARGLVRYSLHILTLHTHTLYTHTIHYPPALLPTVLIPYAQAPTAVVLHALRSQWLPRGLPCLEFGCCWRGVFAPLVAARSRRLAR
jgi:hypothetical protein